MKDKLIQTIYENTKDLRDPITNSPWYSGNNVDIAYKSGNVNISIAIKQNQELLYSKLIEEIKKIVQDIDEMLIFMDLVFLE